MTIYAIGAALIAGLACALAVQDARRWRERYKSLEIDAAVLQRRIESQQVAIIKAKELEHEATLELARLKAGAPADRVRASVDILRDVSERTGAAPKPAPGVADLAAAARRPKP
jgi:hypothetical protein